MIGQHDGKVMIKILYLLMSSRDPIRPTDKERPEFEALFEQGFINYAYNIELGDGYLISEKGLKIVSWLGPKDTV